MKAGFSADTEIQEINGDEASEIQNVNRYEAAIEAAEIQDVNEGRRILRGRRRMNKVRPILKFKNICFLKFSILI